MTSVLSVVNHSHKVAEAMLLASPRLTGIAHVAAATLRALGVLLGGKEPETGTNGRLRRMARIQHPSQPSNRHSRMLPAGIQNEHWPGFPLRTGGMTGCRQASNPE